MRRFEKVEALEGGPVRRNPPHARARDPEQVRGELRNLSERRVDVPSGQGLRPHQARHFRALSEEATVDSVRARRAGDELRWLFGHFRAFSSYNSPGMGEAFPSR